MSVKTLQGTPVQIDLTLAARDTGWSIDGVNGVHEACNAGEIAVKGLALLENNDYKVTFFINSITSGIVQLRLGAGAGIAHTTPGFKSEVITALGASPKLRFYSDGNSSVKLLAIQNNAVENDPKQQNSLIYHIDQNKWKAFWTYVMDKGSSIFTDTYTFKDGDIYLHAQGNTDRNNFAGVQYKSIVNVPFMQASDISKTYLSLSVQSNELLVTTQDGVKTSLGMVSELIEGDFLKDTLIDGVTSVQVFDKEGVYSSFFLRDKNDDIINGAELKGRYATVEITTTDDNSANLLQLYTVQIITAISKIGAR